MLDTLLVEPGTTVAVGTPIAVLHDAAEAPSAVPEPRAAAAAPEPVPVATPVTAAPVVLSPLVRHRAEEQHLDLTAVAGTGPGGRIRRADVER